ncbi:conserved protein of unknown function [Georgfuchsia toluolica]|uniref:Nucleotidyltransferase-like domain-containing protein n=1 Tax=Georgfuchsia toluolica TaxID=424218 RepID=A0A916N3B1_9PROT|nr:GSU2403 family nucleotidyltransferase fold protein [Georgfuchsia toluolica]CAG4884814.1 conserved protein of unknown function [Georgfuchsia toluolica]
MSIANIRSKPLYRPLDLAFRTQYAEVKERAQSAGALLPGSPGTLVERSGMAGGPFWYRVYNPVPTVKKEEYVCAPRDAEVLQRIREDIEFHRWMASSVSTLRKLGFQTASKEVARVLVELHNRGAFEAGLVLAGTLSFMAWLNELGVAAVAEQTLDIDVARRQPLKFAVPLNFLDTMKATGLPFFEVPGMPSTAPSTSVKLPGKAGLRVDLLAPHASLGTIVRIPELNWSAEGIPFYDYLLEGTLPGALLAGFHCIPVQLPQPERFIWHKLYSSRHRRHVDAAKADKDEKQARTLAAVLAEEHAFELVESTAAVPAGMRKSIATVLKRWRMDDALPAALKNALEQVTVF